MSGLRHRDWHLVAEQKFRKRAMVKVVGQHFRGQPYIVLADAIGGQYLRLNARARLLWEGLDGKRTMQQIWRDLAALPNGLAPAQGELMEWLLQLSSAGLVLSDHEIDARHLSHRADSRKDRQLEGKAMSPLALRVALFDPSRIVAFLYPLARPLFSRFAAISFVILVLAALIAALLNRERILSNSDTLLLSQSGFWAMFFAYPIMKALHELGHALVLHHYGGRVREAGVMFLIFFPVPYVDASAAAAIPSHRARMLVGAAGVIVELAMAAGALLLWLQADSGVFGAVLFSFVVMGTISTLAFNGNPLLKFDAYYVLADGLQIPNMAQKASALLQDRFLALLLGLRPREVAARDEAPILLLYGAGALVYRLLLTFVIIAIVSQLFFVVGMILAAWSLCMSVLWPLMKTLKKGREMAREDQARRSVSLRLMIFTALAALLLFALPLPFSVSGQGQIVTAPSAEIRAGAAGFVQAGEVLAEGATVSMGQQILQLDDQEQALRLQSALMALEQNETALAAAGLSVAQRRVYQARGEALQSRMTNLQALEQKRSLKSPLAGRLAWVAGRPPPEGVYIERGDLIARIATQGQLEAVIALPAFFAGVLPEDGSTIELRLHDGSIYSETLARRRVLDEGDPVPEPLLARMGGTIAEEAGGTGLALAPAIAAWVRIESDLSASLGQRVEARLSLPPRSLARQILFHLDRIFLRVTRF